jgi:multisubunit Na+/H+ antiporter MnhG subunit
MRAVYRVLAALVPVLVLVQAASIAFGTFGILNFVDGGDDYTKAVAEDRGATGGVGQNIHSFGAIAVALVAIVLLIVSFFAKIEGGVKWAGLVFLAVLAQWVLAIVAFSAPVVGALHGINAFVIFGVGMGATQAARSRTAAPEGAPSGATV